MPGGGAADTLLPVLDVQSLKIDRSAVPSARRKGGGRARRSPWFARAVVLAILGGAAWLLWSPIQGLIDRLTLPRVELLRVVSSRPAEAGAVQGTAANGYVVAARRAALSADTPGRIVAMNVTEGSVVREGEVVAELFRDEYAASLARAEAALGTAEASVGSAEAALGSAERLVEQRDSELAALQGDIEDADAQFDLAKLRFDRAKELVASKIASQDELDAATTNLESATARRTVARGRLAAGLTAVTQAEAQVVEARARIEVAKAQAGEARAARDLAQVTLDKTEVRAPFDGVVVLKDAEVGEVVSPNSQGGSNARGSVCTMVDFDSLEVQADVPESSLQAVQVGGRVSIFLDAFPEKVYPGRVDRIWPTADRQKATIEVRARFDQRDEMLRPEMGVRIVFLPADTGEPAPVTAEQPLAAVILLPEDAVVRLEGQDVVFVYEQGVARVRPVTVGGRRGSRVAVDSGLAEGEQVIAAPPARLEDGARVLVADS